MAYRRSDEGGRVVGFKDGQPVYKKTNRGQSPSRGGERVNSGKRSERPEGERSHRRDEERGGRREGLKRERFERRSEDAAAGKTVRRSEKRYEEPKPLPKYDPETRPNENDEADLPNIIMGRNPVKEAIKSGRSIDRILVTKEHDGSLSEILELAREAKLVVRDVDRAKLDEICMPFGHNGRTGNHQGILAYIPGAEYCELADILELARERGEEPFVILLDGVEDPHNLGSIIRSAECAGAHGVVIPKRRSATVTAAVVKTSAGATEHMKIARVTNLVSAIAELKESGVWVAGADMGGGSVYKADLKGAFALVVGAEGAGISRLVKEKCDFVVSIPLKGEMESLNAAVAAAVIMFEKVRQEQ